MATQRRMAGGGTLTIEELGGRIHFHATRPQDGRGLYKVWIFGSVGRMLLGTMTPQGDSLQLSRTLSRTSLLSAGCYPVAGGEVVMAFPFQQKNEKNPIPQGWEITENIAVLFQDKLLKQGIYPKNFLKKQEDFGFLLAIKFDITAEFPVIPLFCLCGLEKLEGIDYLVWKFDELGRPIFWNKT